MLTYDEYEHDDVLDLQECYEITKEKHQNLSPLFTTSSTTTSNSSSNSSSNITITPFIPFITTTTTITTKASVVVEGTRLWVCEAFLTG